MIKREQLDEWIAMEKAATPGPWASELDIFNSEEGIVATIADEDTIMLAMIGTSIVLKVDPGGAWNSDLERAKNEAWAKAKAGPEIRDAAFIASARTSVPLLIAEVEVLRTLLAESKRDHSSTVIECAREYRPHRKCDCGADEWNAKVDAAIGDDE